MSHTFMRTSAQAAYNSAEKAYTQAIETREFFDKLLDAIPLEKKEIYEQIRALSNESVNAINAAWDAKYAAELALVLLEKGGLAYE
jgi:hypothetical protein